MYFVSEGFGCEAKLREACLALLDLVYFQFNLGDVWRLVRELFVEAACVTLALQLGHIRRSDLSLERTQLQWFIWDGSETSPYATQSVPWK